MFVVCFLGEYMVPGPGEAPLVAAVLGPEVLRQRLDDLEVPGLHRVVAVADLSLDDLCGNQILDAPRHRRRGISTQVVTSSLVVPVAARHKLPSKLSWAILRFAL